MPLTLEQLIARARVEADMVGSEFVTDRQAKDMVNDEWAELYELMVTKYEDYFVTSHDIALVAGTDTYALPDGSDEDIPGVFKLRGVDVIISANETFPIRPFQWSERGRRLAPDASGSIRVWYVPNVTLLNAAAGEEDDYDAVLPAEVKPGWERFIVFGAAMRMLRKEQSDVSELKQEKLLVRQVIENAAEKRDADAPARMIRRGDYSVAWFANADLRYCYRGSSLVLAKTADIMRDSLHPEDDL